MAVFSSQFYCFYQSPLGQIRLIEIQEHLSQADFVEDLPQAENISETFKESYSAFLLTVCQQLDEYFTGIRQKFDLKLKPQGTAFQCSAWNALLRVQRSHRFHPGQCHAFSAGLVHLTGLTKLTYLSLASHTITDAGLLHLKGLTKLTYLSLRGTKVTYAGVKQLQQALPNCKIKH